MNFFSSILFMLLEQIGKNSNQSSQQQMVQSPPNTGSPGSQGNSLIFTGHQPLSMDLIASFTLHVRIQ